MYLFMVVCESSFGWTVQDPILVKTFHLQATEINSSSNTRNIKKHQNKPQKRKTDRSWREFKSDWRAVQSLCVCCLRLCFDIDFTSSLLSSDWLSLLLWSTWKNMAIPFGHRVWIRMVPVEVQTLKNFFLFIRQISNRCALGLLPPIFPHLCLNYKSLFHIRNLPESILNTMLNNLKVNSWGKKLRKKSTHNQSSSSSNFNILMYILLPLTLHVYDSLNVCTCLLTTWVQYDTHVVL